MSDFQNLGVEDAFQIIVRYLRGEPLSCQDIKRDYYSYDVYLPHVMADYIGSVTGQTGHDAHEAHRREMDLIFPAFYAAGWELCRRGILRPGPSRYSPSDNPPYGIGSGYTLTPVGRQWLKEAARYDAVPVEPGRFPTLLDSCAPQFGPAFRERAQEAIRCYGSLCHLACCVMCGAAAEAIILAIAVEKQGNEEEVLRLYNTSSGRRQVENMILGKQDDHIKREFTSSNSLLKYWRDNAAHGATSSIADAEAYTSMTLLLRFAMFVSDRWNDLIAK